mgnify:CR=1 FL=1
MLSALAAAQSPTTTYPYLYPTFTEGKVILRGGKEEERNMNIHLRRDNLHYIDNGIIKAAFLTDVIAVEIGNDVFIPVDGRMLKVVAKNENGCVAEEILGDFETSLESGGAYGTSSASAATMKLTSVQTDSQVNQNYMNILNEKEKGVELRTETRLWLVGPEFRVRAVKKEVAALLDGEKVEGWKAFLKQHKIKWKEPQSLLEVIDYMVR